MADDKRGREKQSRDADDRQRARDVLAELERGDETEPEVDESALGELVPALESLSYPATGAAVVDAVGGRSVEASGATHTVADLVPESEGEVFDSPESVKARVQRPTVAGAMKRVVEAAGEHQSAEFGTSQRRAYEKTLRALAAVDADDDDEGIDVVTDWLVERIREKETLPGSRAVRRQAAAFCRERGHQVSSNDWLGV